MQGLSTDARGTVEALARHYGITPAQAVQATTQAQTQANPELEALRREIHELKGFQSQYTQQARSSLEGQVRYEEEAFVDERDESGALMRPYYHDPEVYQTACAKAYLLRQANPEAPVKAILEKAYDDAVWSIPRTRELAMAKASASAERKRIEAVKAKSQSARIAGSSLAGAGAIGGVPRQAGDSVQDELRRAYDELSN